MDSARFTVKLPGVYTMSHKFQSGAAAFMIVLLAACGCQTTNRPPTELFTEAPFVDVVLQFAAWDCIFVTEPNLRQDGFQRVLTRATVAEAVTGATKGRGLAVVVFNATQQGDTQAGAIADWLALLKQTGFERVVILRAGIDSRIQGLEILEDSQTSKRRSD